MAVHSPPGVPVEPLAAAYLASGLPLLEVCRRLGWRNPHQRTTALRRALGLAPIWSPHTRACTVWAKHIGYDQAVQIARALGIDPVDVGL